MKARAALLGILLAGGGLAAVTAVLLADDRPAATLDPDEARAAAASTDLLRGLLPDARVAATAHAAAPPGVALVRIEDLPADVGSWKEFDIDYLLTGANSSSRLPAAALARVGAEDGWPPVRASADGAVYAVSARAKASWREAWDDAGLVPPLRSFELPADLQPLPTGPVAHVLRTTFPPDAEGMVLRVRLRNASEHALEVFRGHVDPGVREWWNAHKQLVRVPRPGGEVTIGTPDPELLWRVEPGAHSIVASEWGAALASPDVRIEVDLLPRDAVREPDAGGDVRVGAAEDHVLLHARQPATLRVEACAGGGTEATISPGLVSTSHATLLAVATTPLRPTDGEACEAPLPQGMWTLTRLDARSLPLQVKLAGGYARDAFEPDVVLVRRDDATYSDVLVPSGVRPGWCRVLRVDVEDDAPGLLDLTLVGTRLVEPLPLASLRLDGTGDVVRLRIPLPAEGDIQGKLRHVVLDTHGRTLRLRQLDAVLVPAGPAYLEALGIDGASPAPTRACFQNLAEAEALRAATTMEGRVGALAPWGAYVGAVDLTLWSGRPFDDAATAAGALREQGVDVVLGAYARRHVGDPELPAGALRSLLGDPDHLPLVAVVDGVGVYRVGPADGAVATQRILDAPAGRVALDLPSDYAGDVLRARVEGGTGYDLELRDARGALLAAGEGELAWPVLPREATLDAIPKGTRVENESPRVVVRIAPEPGLVRVRDEGAVVRLEPPAPGEVRWLDLARPADVRVEPCPEGGVALLPGLRSPEAVALAGSGASPCEARLAAGAWTLAKLRDDVRPVRIHLAGHYARDENGDLVAQRALPRYSDLAVDAPPAGFPCVTLTLVVRDVAAQSRLYLPADGAWVPLADLAGGGTMAEREVRVPLATGGSTYLILETMGEKLPLARVGAEASASGCGAG